MTEILLGMAIALVAILLVFPLLWAQAYAQVAWKMDSSDSSLLRHVATSITLPILLAIALPLLVGKFVILRYDLSELIVVISWIFSLFTLLVLTFHLFVKSGEKKSTS